MYNRLDSIPACDWQTDRWTDILPWHSPLCISHYAVKTVKKNLNTAEPR